MDWKDALSALAATPQPEDNADKKEVTRKKRVGVVYSTNPDYNYHDEADDQVPLLPPHQQRLRLSMERAGRGGKTVTIVRGFQGPDSDFQQLAKMLKQRCGVGGTAKDGEIIIQGDHRQRLLEILKSAGYSQARG